MKIPCEECLTRPICKDKSYPRLIECIILKTYLYKDPNRNLTTANRKSYFPFKLMLLDKIFKSDHYSKVILFRIKKY